MPRAPPPLRGREVPRRFAALIAVLLAVLVATACGVTGSSRSTPAKKSASAQSNGTLTIYIRNTTASGETDQQIRRAIPAWEAAANGRFRQVWHTPRLDLIFIGQRQEPRGTIAAVFGKKGPVKGALAYHTQLNGTPRIVVYSGVGDYYGYSNSVSFTHEMFELLGDEHTASINQGWPVSVFTIDHGQFANPDYLPVPPGQLVINEMCDPVEAQHYVLNHTWISDWVTPNFFNDEQVMPAGVPEYDAMGLVQQPLTILPGGYQSLFVVDFYASPDMPSYTGWLSVTNFRHAGRDAAGFLDDTGGKVLAR